MDGETYIKLCQKYLAEGLTEDEIILKISNEQQRKDVHPCESNNMENVEEEK